MAPAGKLSHLQINVDAANFGFYNDLFGFLGWDPIHSDEQMTSFNSEGNVSLWFVGGANSASNDRDGIGVNHIALAADSQVEVDRTVGFLKERGTERLFDTPQHRPDFTWEEGQTYYQVMFASPDGILFEHVYIGPKQD